MVYKRARGWTSGRSLPVLNFLKYPPGLQIFNNKKWGWPCLFLSYKHLKLKLRVFLAGHIVAMVTYCATKLATTYSQMIGQFVDIMILVSTGIEWL